MSSGTGQDYLCLLETFYILPRNTHTFVSEKEESGVNLSITEKKGLPT